ncbi:hypothetical protein R6Q59_029639 [Mikania micrantha]
MYAKLFCRRVGQNLCKKRVCFFKTSSPSPASSSFTPSATSSSTDHCIHSAPRRANLTYGGLTGVEGLYQEELFLWLPVKDIIIDDPKSGLILFDIGLAHKQLSLSLWDSGADFMQLKKKSRKVIGFHAQI